MRRRPLWPRRTAGALSLSLSWQGESSGRQARAEASYAASLWGMGLQSQLLASPQPVTSVPSVATRSLRLPGRRGGTEAQTVQTCRLPALSSFPEMALFKKCLWEAGKCGEEGRCLRTPEPSHLPE